MMCIYALTSTVCEGGGGGGGGEYNIFTQMSWKLLKNWKCSGT